MCGDRLWVLTATAGSVCRLTLCPANLGCAGRILSRSCKLLQRVLAGTERWEVFKLFHLMQMGQELPGSRHPCPGGGRLSARLQQWQQKGRNQEQKLAGEKSDLSF